MSELASPPAYPPDVPTGRTGHLYEIDIVRILTFACVIAVHTTSHTADANSVGTWGFLTLLHITREVFFALTAFVLIYSYTSRPVPMRKFWPRRFLLVGVPYVAWSAIYFIASNLHTPHGTLPDMVGRFFVHLFAGTAWYHLYFLLVTMQVYLLLPVIAWAVRKTRGHHLMLLSISLVLQLVLTGFYMYKPEALGWVNDYNKQYFFSYQFFILFGAVAADHSRTVMEWVSRHRRLILLIVVITAAVTMASWSVHLQLGYSLAHAARPLQPILGIWSMAVGLGFLAIGSWWAERRRADSLVARAVDVGSDRSFGIFLSHPLFIWLLLWVGNDWLPNHVPKPWLTPLTYLLVIAGSIGLTELARRSWLSLPLTGRPFRSERVAHPTPAQSETSGVT